MLAPRGSVVASPDAIGHRVLTVDDEARLRDVLVRILGNEGIRADAAPDAKQALSMFRTTSYDLIILDLLMPEVDGFSLLSEIMSTKPDQGVLVLSCLTDLDSKTAALGLGADDYLAKPFHVQELIARVQARLRSISRQAGGAAPRADRPGRAAEAGGRGGGSHSADLQGVPAALGAHEGPGRRSFARGAPLSGVGL